MTDVIASLVTFGMLCAAWVAIGRRHTVRVVRIERNEEQAA